MSAKLEKVNIIPHDDGANVPAIQSAPTPMALLDRALASGADVVMIERLMGLQERWEANQARKAFDEAISSAKAKIPPIARNAKGHNDKRYANFAAIATVVDPILSENGLSYRFRTTQTDKISVTCILSHKAGHSEETTLAGPADSSGNKNAIQAIGSTLTYLQRYSLVQMLGLAAAADDDGNAADKTDDTPPPPGSVSQKQADDIRELLESLGVNGRAFLAWVKQSRPDVKRIEEIPAEYFEACVTEIKRVAAARK